MKLRHYPIIAAFALLAASCSHEESTDAQRADLQLTISASFADSSALFEVDSAAPTAPLAAPNATVSSATRATATAFESGDSLGLYAVRSGGELNAGSNLINNHKFKVSSTGAIVGDMLPAFYPDQTTSLDLFSYYPYQSGNATADALGVLVGIRTHQTDFSSLMASDCCYGSKLSAAPSTAAHPLRFKHIFAQLRLNFSLYENCPAIASVKILKVRDQAKLNLQTGAVTLSSSSTVVDIEPFISSADAANPLQFTAILPPQSLSAACLEITLSDGTIYYYNATSPIALTPSATNTLNLRIYSRTGGGDPTDPSNPESDKGGVRLDGSPIITAWGVEATRSSISESTDNTFTFYWSPAITSFATINKVFITLTNVTTKKSVRLEVDAFVRDATSTEQNAIFRFAITRADAASIGYPVTIDKLELFSGATAVHTLTDYYGRTVTKSGPHTLGTVTSIKLSPDGDWLGVANTAQSRKVVVTTTGNTSWSAEASPNNIGLTVTPSADKTYATISWAAQLTTGDSPLRSGTVTFTTVPSGVSYVMATSQLMGPYYLAVTPATAWANVANSVQSRPHTVATGNLAGWTATATSTPTAGLTVTASGTRATPAIASWAAQAVGALARTGSITITPNPATVGGIAGGIAGGTQTAPPITITTNQLAGPAPTLTISADKPTDDPVSKDGTTYTINVTSNTAWSVLGSNVTVDPPSAAASTDGTDKVTSVNITVAKTESSTTTALSAIFTTDAVPSGATAAKTWAGKQAAALTISVSPTTWTGVGVAGTSKDVTLTLTGTTKWSASSNNNGLTIEKINATTARLTWKSNYSATGDARDATVTFKTDPEGAECTLYSSQNGAHPTISISSTSWTGVANTAQSKEITVTVTGGTWTAKTSGSGLSVSPTSGASGAKATVKYAAQSAGAAARTGSVVFSTVPATTPSATTATLTTGQNKGTPAGSVDINGTYWALSNAGSATWDDASDLCPAPWRLPSKEDFENLIKSGKMNEVTGITSGNYWSSTTYPNFTNTAYSLNFGHINYSGKAGNYGVRCCQ